MLTGSRDRAARGSAPDVTQSARPKSDAVHTEVWFGPDERPLFGWVSVPAGGRARGGVVLCPPIGEEGRSAHRTFRRLAEALADAGLLALRFDYDGTGDSAGAQDDPDRVGSWLASVEAGRQYLLSLGVPGVAAVGMRLGATLAARQVVDSGVGFDSLVLWDPCLSGRTFLREGEALHQFGEGSEAGGIPDDGLRHTPGFQFDAATAIALRALDLGRLPTTTPLAERVLLLTREDRPAPPAIHARLALEGERLETGPALDQALLLDLAPSDNFVPVRALREVVAWLVAGGSGEPVVVAAPAPAGSATLASGRTGSPQVTEHAVRLGSLGLFGIVSEPLDPVAPADDTRPWVVLVNVAIEHHIGPGRRWVDFARRWAALGYRCVRIDQSGVGDSPRHPGQPEGEIFSPAWLDDMQEVVTHLSVGGAPVIMVGLCSGAYSSFEAAMFATVDSVFAVNPRLTLYPAARGTEVFTRRRRAAVVPAWPIAALARHGRIVAGGMWRIYRQVAVWHAPFAMLRRVVRRGTFVEVITCHHDGKHFTEVVFWRPALRRLERRGELRFEQTEALDHSLLGRRSQEFMWDRATAFLERRHRAVGR